MKERGVGEKSREHMKKNGYNNGEKMQMNGGK